MSEAAEAVASQPAIGDLVELPVGLVKESPFNPRRTFDEASLRELADDVARRGVLQPVLVREKPSPTKRSFELVVGARRLRACKLAKRETIPALIRSMSDQEVLETQIAENAQRDDVHPLEEGDGYRRLHEQFRVSIDEIAARVSKSRRLVYARIQLSRLGAAGRKALFEGLLTPSTALLAATLADAKHQDEFVATLVEYARRDKYGRPKARGTVADPMPYQDALDQLRDRFDLRLAGARWELDDAGLVPAAGACSACPKRSSAQADLFEDPVPKADDSCTDRGCWQGKLEAWRERLVSKARAEGKTVLEGKAAKAALSHGGTYASVTEQAWRHGVSGKREDQSLKRVLGKNLPPTSVAIDEKGEAHEVVARADLKAAIRKAGLGSKRDDRTSARSSADTRSAKIARFRNLVAARARARIVEAAESYADALGVLPGHSDSGGVWRLISRAFVREIWHESRKGVCARRRLDVPKRRRSYGSGQDFDGALEGLIASSTPAAALGLAVELSIARPIPQPGAFYRENEDRGKPYGAAIHEAADVFGIDLEVVEAEVARYLVAVAGPKAKPAAKARSKAKPARSSKRKARA